MGRVISRRLAEAQRQIAEQLYNKVGASAVYDYANKVKSPYHKCNPCEAETPTIITVDGCECMVCGEDKKID